MADTDGLDDAAVESRLNRLDQLLDRLEHIPGPTTDAALEAIQLLTEVYGEALTRVLHTAGDDVSSTCTKDLLLRHLMVLHGLHPGSTEDRVEQALADLRPGIESQGGQLELVSIEDAVATIRLSAGGCSHSSAAAPIDQVVTESILALAPELERVEALAATGTHRTQAVIPVEALLRRPAEVGGPG